MCWSIPRNVSGLQHGKVSEPFKRFYCIRKKKHKENAKGVGEYGIKLLDLGQETNAVSQKRVKDFKDVFPKDTGGSFCEKLWN